MSVLMSAVAATMIASAGLKGVPAPMSSVEIATAAPRAPSICRVITDILVIDGEEAPVARTLCRVPGAMGFRPVDRLR